ncbi:MAG: hypothetical protein BGO38_12585 [Cellulomonas sp. 73-145]|uniref:aspartate/glutamate racemase family protein n=1 Tax=Cellulomonas sp. 73-145 TaxID=1895739 RepID=UPI0009276C90|nr:aspartate/glutamate racemase family protein [Cellulomonas sp. 73-145]OJV59897.1 MAG: hypothetical protein BGO38_12585 [Cellulomonas sp. 73-145]
MTAGLVGLLHTVPGLVPTFDGLLDDARPGLRRVHVADAWLLSTAVAVGVTDEVRRAVLAHVRHLVDVGAGAVLVTCSSIGEVADEVDGLVDVPVVRVDAAMADEAVARAAGGSGSVTVLATLASTLGPTARLVERSARAAGRQLAVEATVVEGAFDARSARDLGRHDELVAQAARAAAARADVVVLAQASMAGAAAGAAPGVAVLSSPASGVRRFLEVVDGVVP